MRLTRQTWLRKVLRLQSSTNKVRELSLIHILQELAHRMGVHEIRFENVREIQPIDTSSHAIIRDPNKCILGGDCVRMCDNVQNINAIDFAYRGTDAQVIPAFNKKIAETDCVLSLIHI